MTVNIAEENGYIIKEIKRDCPSDNWMLRFDKHA